MTPGPHRRRLSEIRVAWPTSTPATSVMALKAPVGSRPILDAEVPAPRHYCLLFVGIVIPIDRSLFDLFEGRTASSRVGRTKTNLGPASLLGFECLVVEQ